MIDWLVITMWRLREMSWRSGVVLYTIGFVVLVVSTWGACAALYRWW